MNRPKEEIEDAVIVDPVAQQAAIQNDPPMTVQAVPPGFAAAFPDVFVPPPRDQVAIEQASAKEPVRTVLIERRFLSESPTNTRRRWGDLDGLTKSIAKNGLLEPLIVRELATAADHFEIVAGHRRFRAGKAAGLNEFRCEVRELSDDLVLEFQITENAQREDLHAMEEAEGYELMRKAGYEVPTMAERVGVSTGWIYSRLKLLELGPEGRNAFFEGRIADSVAVVLGRQTHPNQARALVGLAKLIEAGRPVEEQIHYLQKDFARNLKGSPFDLKDTTLPRLCSPDGFGDCVSCPKNSNNAARELFSDYDKIEKAGVCEDVPCYVARAEAVTDRAMEKARERGEKVLTLAETKKVISFGSPIYGSPYVISRDVVAEDPKRRTWQQILEKLPKEERPVTTTAPNDQKPGEVFQLYDRKEAVAAAAKLGVKWAKKSAPEEKQVKANKVKAEKGHEKARLVATVTELAMPKIVESLRKAATLAALRPAALVILDTMMNEERELVAGWFETKSLEKWIRADAAVKDLVAFVVVGTLWLRFSEVAGETFEPTFAAVAREHKVDLQAMTRAQLEQARLEAEKKREPVKPTKAKKGGGK